MEKYYTESEAGSVRIGNDCFTILIPNGYGDCTTIVHVVEKGEEPSEAKFFTSFSGKNVNVYAYDCSGDDVVTTLSGRFGAYRSGKNVYFVRWE